MTTLTIFYLHPAILHPMQLFLLLCKAEKHRCGRLQMLQQKYYILSLPNAMIFLFNSSAYGFFVIPLPDSNQPQRPVLYLQA
jgi:hypothetical protein